jgi:imidazolonepropionase-like amidohydrolase
VRLAVCLLLLGLLCSAQNLQVRNVTIIDSAGVRPNQTVTVVRGRIAGVGPSRGGAATGSVDGKGKYLIPALWDMHVHLWESEAMQNLYVAAGVLGVRDMGSDIARVHKLRKDIIAGRVIGPRIYTSGPVLDGHKAPDMKAPVLECATPEAARQAVDAVEKQSADFIKLLSNLTPDAYRAAAQRARVIRMPFAGHVPEGISIQEAIDARQRSIEHMFGIPLACTPLEPMLRHQRAEAVAKNDRDALAGIRKRVYETFSPGLANQLFHEMARYDVWQTPTLVLWQRLELQRLEELATAPELKYVPESIRKTWPDPRRQAEGLTPERLAELKAEYDFYARIAKLAWGSGAGFLAGTDTGDPYVVPGFALHDELEAMVAAGIPAEAALASATAGPAKYFGIEATSGSVAKGKVADLVLLDGDPLADIRNTRKIHAVVWNGKLLGRKCLDSLLGGRQTGCPVSVAAPTPRPAKPLAPAKKSGAPRRPSSAKSKMK